MKKHTEHSAQAEASPQNPSGVRIFIEDQTMSLSFGRDLLRIFTVLLVVTGLLMLVMGWTLYRSLSKTDELLERGMRVQKLIGTIIHFDEVLTMSAAMAVASENREGETSAYWEERYRKHERELDAAIEEAARIASGADSSKAAIQTDTANRVLVGLDNRAFDLVRQGRRQDAHAVLISSEYREQKKLYADGTSRLTALVQEEVEHALIAQQKQTTSSMAWLSVFVVIVFAGWAGMIVVFQHWRQSSEEGQTKLRTKTDELAELNVSLDERVDERTAELTLSEERYRGMIEDQTEFICRYKPDSTLTFVNEAYCRLLGKSKEELIGVKIVDLPGDPAKLELFKGHLKELIALTPENPIRQGDSDKLGSGGARRWQEWTDRALFDENGRVVEIQAVGRDVTAQRLAEQRLNAQYELTRVLAESRTVDEAASRLLQVICESVEWDLGEVWTVNLALGELQNVHVWSRPGIDVQAFVNESRKVHFARGVGLPGRIWKKRSAAWIENLHADPQFIRGATARACGLCSAFGLPIVNGDEFLGVIDFISQEPKKPDESLLRMVQAISYRFGQFIDGMRADEALRESEARTRMLLESTGEGIYGVNTLGRCTFINGAGARMLGYSADEVLGKDTHKLFHHHRPDHTHYPTEQSPTVKVYKTGQPCRISDEVYWKKDGSPIPVEYCSYPIWNDQGVISGAVVVFSNISERKNVEAQLQHAQKMEAIGQLAGGIAHDFNNILASMLGYARLALDQVDEEGELKDNIQQITLAGSRGRDLVSRIMMFSRHTGETGVQTPCQLGDLVKDALKMLRPVIPAAVEIRTEIAPSLSPVLVNPTQIHQILLNLSINASQAMPTGGKLTVSVVEVEVPADHSGGLANSSVGETLRPGRYQTLSVEDTGQGIPEENLPKIFDPFFTTKKIGQGSGMGLATVYGAVKDLRGEIRVRSEVGKGTRFDIFLPPVQKISKTRPEEKAKSVGGEERILVVDDEEALARMVEKALSRLGYRVTVRTNSMEALELFKKDPDQFDLAVLDQLMPDLTGDVLAEEFNRLRPEMPILVCTGFNETLTEERQKQVGIRKSLNKPTADIELEEEVRRALDERKRVQAQKTSKESSRVPSKA